MDLSLLSNLILFAMTPAAVNWIVSNVLDNIPAFTSLPGQTKSFAVLALAIVLGLVAYLVATYVSPDLIARIQPYYSIIFVMISSWLSGQIAHQVTIRGQVRRAALKEQKARIQADVKALFPKG